MAPEPQGMMVRKIPIAEIDRNPDQPRTFFDEDHLLELAESISTHGVIQPLLVRARGDRYQLVAGERRFRAASLAGLTEVPALIEEMTDQKQLEIALIENIQREDLNAMEEARAYQTLVDLYSMSQEEVAHAVGKARATIANALRLLKLPASVQQDIEAGRISAGHARALLSLPTEAQQRLLHGRILEEELSVRAAERLAREMLSGPEEAEPVIRERIPDPSEIPVDPQVRELQDKLIEAMGVMIKFKPSGPTKGRIEMRYDSLDDLDRILDKLGVQVDSI